MKHTTQAVVAICMGNNMQNIELKQDHNFHSYFHAPTSSTSSPCIIKFFLRNPIKKFQL